MVQPDSNRIVTYDVMNAANAAQDAAAAALTTRVTALDTDSGWVTLKASSPLIQYRKLGHQAQVYVYDPAYSFATGFTTLGTALVPSGARPAMGTAPAVADLAAGFAGVARVNSAGDVVVANNTGATRVGVSALIAYWVD